jgi:CheY-like chemotaxis protein
MTGCSVLIVDDDPSIREALCELMRTAGYAAWTASDGAEALATLRETDGRADVIVLDLMMPGMNGWEFLDEKHEDPLLERIPVIVVSAHEDQSSLRLDRVIARLKKPFDFDALLGRIRQVCPA